MRGEFSFHNILVLDRGNTQIHMYMFSVIKLRNNLHLILNYFNWHLLMNDEDLIKYVFNAFDCKSELIANPSNYISLIDIDRLFFSSFLLFFLLKFSLNCIIFLKFDKIKIFLLEFVVGSTNKYILNDNITSSLFHFTLKQCKELYEIDESLVFLISWIL